MVSILDEIINKLKEFSFSIPVDDVRRVYSSKKPTYPMITVQEVRNTPLVQIHGEEKISKLGYRFEIYGRDTTHNGVVYTKSDIVTKIGNELDEFMRKNYGMIRIGEPMMFPANVDKTVMRYILTYEGIIDNETMIIYQ